MFSKKITSPKVFVVILNYNGIETLNDCLTSVFKSSYNNFEIVVVDNDSKDGSFEQARHNFSRAHFIKNSSNAGFAQGNNVGIRFALEKFADFVFILNNDTLIEKDTILTLVKHAVKEKEAGILSPLIKKTDDDEIWFAGGILDWKKMRAEHLFTTLSNDPYESQYLSGCSMLIKKDVFKKIGLFDERYFLYYEDADLSYRARLAGFKLLLVPQTSIIHLEQSNQKNNSKLYWLVLSGLIFFLTHSKTKQKLWIYPYLFARKMKNFYNLFFSKNNTAKEIRRAFKDYAIAKKSR